MCYILLNFRVVISTGVEQLRNLLDLRKESTAPVNLGIPLQFLSWLFTASTTQRIDVTKRVSLASSVNNCACLSRNAGILVGVWEKNHFYGSHCSDRFFPYNGNERVKRHRALPLKVLVKAVTPKCLGGPPVDRDRLNAYPVSKWVE
ncbi:hypothetical protein TNCV_3596031 [Trichonephila clavipes]|nr:hypothetical protein TNCV_3596031 [Trichonephila clavipes]